MMLQSREAEGKDRVENIPEIEKKLDLRALLLAIKLSTVAMLSGLL